MKRMQLKNPELMIWVVVGVLLLACLGLAFVASPGSSNDIASVSFLACDGEDADAILIKSNDRFAMIDTGENACESAVLSYLRSQGVTSLDFILISHPDKDHLGNAVAIMQQYPVSHVYGTDYQKGSDKESAMLEYMSDNHIDYQVIAQETSLAFGSDVTFRVVPPEQTYADANNSSLVTWMTVGNVKFFFAGDIEKARIDEVLAAEVTEADILKLPHHGRYKANLDDLIEVVNPALAIISATVLENKTLTILTEAKLDYLITTTDVVISTDGETWEIRSGQKNVV